MPDRPARPPHLRSRGDQRRRQEQHRRRHAARAGGWSTSTRTRPRAASSPPIPAPARRRPTARPGTRAGACWSGRSPSGSISRSRPRWADSTITGLLERAAARGIEVRVWYVGLSSPELHIARVRARVAKGGHDIPEPRIRERYDASRLNLIRLLPSLTELWVYDNSVEADPDAGVAPEPRLVLHLRRGTIVGPARPEPHAGMGQGDRRRRHEGVRRLRLAADRGPGLHFGADGRIQHGGEEHPDHRGPRHGRRGAERLEHGGRRSGTRCRSTSPARPGATRSTSASR